MKPDQLQKFFPLVKVDEVNRIVYGLVTAERRDKDGETCHYETTKPEYEKVNAELGKASGGENIMPLREMHQLNAVGAGKTITFDDANKQILMAFEVVDDSTWKKVQKKVLLGFSQGGSYIKRWAEGVNKFYTARPGEVSLVDNPCLPGAYIEYAKADGGVEFYRTPGQLSEDDVSRLSKSVISELSTQAEKIRTLLGLSGDSNAATGDAMKPEDIKKCAAALAITEEEFIKTHMAEGKVKAEEKVVEKTEKVEAPPEVLAKADAVKLIEETVATAVTKAVKEAMDKIPANDEASKARLIVERGGAVQKVDASKNSPYPGVV